MSQSWEEVKSDMRAIVDNGLGSLSPNPWYTQMMQGTLEAMIRAYEDTYKCGKHN